MSSILLFESTERAISRVSWYLPLRNVPSTHSTGRQCRKPSIHCPKDQNSRIRYQFSMVYDPSSSLIGSSAMANWVPGFVMEIFRNNLGAWLKDSLNPPNNIFIAFCFPHQAVIYDIFIPVLVCTSSIIDLGIRLMSEPTSVTTSWAT